MSSDVKVGQVWADNDSRGYGRHVKVLGIEEITDPFKHHKVAYAHVVDNSGRKTRIRVDRFRPTANGYRLVSEPE